MPLPVSKKKKLKFFQYVEVNLIPVINIFLIIIPFLVVSVVLSRMVAYNLKLPKKNEVVTKHKVKSNILKVFLKDNYIVIKINDKSIDSLLNNDSLAVKFSNILKENQLIKQCYLVPDDSIMYGDIIAIMDILNENNITQISLKY